MKGIYLTEEGKQELEAKIKELEKVFISNDGSKTQEELVPISLEYKIYKEILSSATILSVEKNYVSSKYPQGVIIQPKS
jgi:hypothetical protein